MPKTDPFERYTSRYEEWFAKNPAVYDLELRAVRGLLPRTGFGIEIGVGTGRFASPLGIRFGVDPSRNMALVAAERGINVIVGQAELLPLSSGTFDYCLMVTVICFLDNVKTALSEIHRVLKPRGILLIGFVDRDAPIGEEYEMNKMRNPFYREAVFYTAADIRVIMEQAGFDDLSFCQTIFSREPDADNDRPIQDGHGRGAFVVARGHKR